MIASVKSLLSSNQPASVASSKRRVRTFEGLEERTMFAVAPLLAAPVQAAVKIAATENSNTVVASQPASKIAVPPATTSGAPAGNLFAATMEYQQSVNGAVRQDAKAAGTTLNSQVVDALAAALAQQQAAAENAANNRAFFDAIGASLIGDAPAAPKGISQQPLGASGGSTPPVAPLTLGKPLVDPSLTVKSSATTAGAPKLDATALKTMSAGASNQFAPLAKTATPKAHVGASPTTTDAAFKQAAETQMSFNLQYLQLQSQMQHENRSYTAVSNIMLTKRDTVVASISNVR